MDPFLGEIRMFAGLRIPGGWVPCSGQLLAIAEFEALFSLIGTTYGGDGRTTFAVPDFRGRIVVSPEPQAGFLPGSRAGSEQVTITASQMPSHTHQLAGNDSLDDQPSPANNFWGTNGAYATQGAPDQQMRGDALSANGGNQPHSNMGPFLAINFIMNTNGVYPPRP